MCVYVESTANVSKTGSCFVNCADALLAVESRSLDSARRALAEKSYCLRALKGDLRKSRTSTFWTSLASADILIHVNTITPLSTAEQIRYRRKTVPLGGPKTKNSPPV